MTIKYVKDFEFPSADGFTGSAGKQTVKGYMRGGAVKRPAPVGTHVGGPNPNAEYPKSQAHQSMPPNSGTGKGRVSMHDKLYKQGKKLGFAKGGYAVIVRGPMDSMDDGVMPAHKGRTQQEIEAGGSKRMKPGYADGGTVSARELKAGRVHHVLKGSTKGDKERALVKKIGQEVATLAKKPVTKKAQGGAVKKAEGGSVGSYDDDLHVQSSLAHTNISNASDAIAKAKKTKDPKRRAELKHVARAANERGLESNEKFKKILQKRSGEKVKPAGYTIGSGAASRAATAQINYRQRQEDQLEAAGITSKAHGGPVAMKKGGKLKNC